MPKFAFLLVVLLLISCSSKNEKVSADKYDRIVTKYTEIKQVISKEVNDTFYIYVRLPKFYNDSDNRYPVLYLLDGDISFNMATSIVRYLQYGRHLPDLIIVAPAYGTMINDEEQNFRERDYTLSSIERFERSGEADKYLKFLKNEFIPFVDKNYRTDSSRTLNGFSLGGLFTLFVLANEPLLFENYIAGSPYILFDINYLLEEFSKIPPFENEKRLFISVGEREDKMNYHHPIQKVSEILKNRKMISVEFRVFNDATHFTSPSEALTYGLKYVFKKNNLREP